MLFTRYKQLEDVRQSVCLVGCLNFFHSISFHKEAARFLVILKNISFPRRKTFVSKKSVISHFAVKVSKTVQTMVRLRKLGVGIPPVFHFSQSSEQSTVLLETKRLLNRDPSFSQKIFSLTQKASVCVVSGKINRCGCLYQHIWSKAKTELHPSPF